MWIDLAVLVLLSGALMLNVLTWLSVRAQLKHDEQVLWAVFSVMLVHHPEGTRDGDFLRRAAMVDHADGEHKATHDE